MDEIGRGIALTPQTPDGLCAPTPSLAPTPVRSEKQKTKKDAVTLRSGICTCNRLHPFH
jgi:hypothetical protein